jgi:hypothetical protein
MSEQTDNRPDPQNEAGEVTPPAPVEGRATSASPADQHPAQKAKMVIPPGKEGWIELHEELPRPTYWPITMAVAITLIAFGIVNALLIIIIGVILLIVSLVGWIGDVRDEARLRKH